MSPAVIYVLWHTAATLQGELDQMRDLQCIPDCRMNHSTDEMQRQLTCRARWPLSDVIHHEIKIRQLHNF